MSGRLPPELLLHVFSYLSLPEDRQTLASLCSTCKYTLCLIQPILYSDLSCFALPNKKLLDQTFSTNRAARKLGSLVRKVGVRLLIEWQTFDQTPELDGPLDALECPTLDLLEKRKAQAMWDLEWSKCKPILGLLTALEELTFSMEGGQEVLDASQPL